MKRLIIAFLVGIADRAPGQSFRRQERLTTRTKVLSPAALVSICFLVNAFGETMYVPHIVTGKDLQLSLRFQTLFEVLNLSDNQIEIRVELVSDDGDPLKVFETGGLIGGLQFVSEMEFELPGYGGEVLRTTLIPMNVGRGTGWAKFESSGPIHITAVLRSWSQEDFHIVTATSVVSVDLTQEFSTFARFRHLHSAGTGIALLNPFQSETEVVFHLISQFGEVLGERSITLEPMGKISQFFDEVPLFDDVGNERGSPVAVEVRSSQPVSAVAIRVDDLYWSGSPILPPRVPIEP